MADDDATTEWVHYSITVHSKYFAGVLFTKSSSTMPAVLETDPVAAVRREPGVY